MNQLDYIESALIQETQNLVDRGELPSGIVLRRPLVGFSKNRVCGDIQSNICFQIADEIKRLSAT